MRTLGFLFCLGCSLVLNAASTPAELSVWVNEAIVSTYTYDYQTYLSQQKQTAHYFTPAAWITYSTVLNASKLPEAVQAHKYAVSAVATDTPVIEGIGANQWKASMPVLVVYKNPQYEQKQTLLVTVVFKGVHENQGVRGYAIESFQSKIEKPTCQCDV